MDLHEILHWLVDQARPARERELVTAAEDVHAAIDALASKGTKPAPAAPAAAPVPAPAPEPDGG